jgi:protein-ribulosamine 3-kinase
MPIPQSILTTLSDSFNIRISNSRTESGGSINRAFRVSTNRGDLFLKYNPSAPDDFFEKEAHGLKELKSAGSRLRIPEVIAVGKPNGLSPGFLLMEFIHEGRNGDSFAFGAELAKLHQTQKNSFGLDRDNYIGSLPQKNEKRNDWISFFVEMRIDPQIKMAVNSGKLSGNIQKNWERLAGQLDHIMPHTEPSLIHGDLWGGNYLFDETGTAVLIDPAVYYGHPEMDLAFSKMFGGFSADFYEGYESVTPLEPGFSERVAVYNMYPLLVHVNLFGGHYTSQFERFIKSF